MSWREYVAIARPSHWPKNVFVLPGVFVAALMLDVAFSAFAFELLKGLFSVCLLASANYVINEWLDAQSDRHHPVKNRRPSVAGHLERRWVYLEYCLLAVSGMGLAASISMMYLWTSCAFLIMGLIYNVKPLRAKDRPFLDVLVESTNNPIRLTLGWTIVTSVELPPSSIEASDWVGSAFLMTPPSSLVVGYWMGGAFLMAVKRFGEYRFISDPERAGAYRRSFTVYTEESLLISSFFYAMFCALFLGVFLVKYRIELLLSLPFLAILFAWYLHIAFKPNSPVQYPERLHRERWFFLYCGVLVVIFVVLFWIDVEPLKWFLEKAFITE